MLPTWVLGLFNQYKLITGQRRSSGKALWWPVMPQEGKETANRCPCWFPGDWGELVS